MSDRRRRRRRPGGSDRPQDVPQNASGSSHDDRSHGDRARDDRDPWAEYESRPARDASAVPSEEPADEGTLADALAEFERRRDELIQARREQPADERPRRERDRRTDDAAAEQDDDPDWADRDWDADADADWDDARDEEPADAGRGINPARRGLGTSRANPALSAAVFEQDADEEAELAPVRVRSVAAPTTPRPRSTAAAAAETADARRGYSLRTPREVRRDGPVAWTLRGYRRFRRQLRQNLTAYGHRYNTVGPNAATDSKPALLWLVDFPRLVGMWISHIDYRTTRAVTLTFRDLRSRPTRIPFSAAEVLSPHVAFTVPTCADLNPIWRWPAVRTWTREFRNDWRNALTLAAAGAGAAVAGAKEEFSAELTAVGDRTGRGLAWTQAQATRFDRLFRPTGRNDDRAWWFACGSGMCGLFFTSLLFLFNEPAAAEVNAVAALTPKKVETAEPVAPPVSDAALEPDREGFDDPPEKLFDEDLFGGDLAAEEEPDPTLIARGNSSPTLESDADMFGGLPNPFPEGDGMDDFALEPAPESYVRPLPALTIELRRAEPDFSDGLPGYEPPDDDVPAEAVAAPVRTPLPADPGGWDEERRRSEPAAPALPPEYIGVSPDADPAPAPSGGNGLNDPSFDPDFPDDFGAAPDDAPADKNWGAASFPNDGSQTDLDLPANGVPAAAGAGLTVTRTAPGAATLGAPYTYDLWVKNEGDAPATAVLEEAVGPGVRVTHAEPPASFLPAGDAARDLAAGPGAGGGILTWDLASLPPGAVRQLSVTVHPLPGAVGEGHEQEIAFTTDARVTGRWAVTGATVVMAPPEPEPEPEPVPPAEPPVDRWEPDWPSDPPIVNDFDDFPADPAGLPLEEPFEEEPIEEPVAEEPASVEEPAPFEEPAWEPQPLPDPAVRPAQILRPELDEEEEAFPEPTLEPVPQSEPAETEEPAKAPRLRVVLAGPRGVRAGEDVRLTVTVTNEGSGPAAAVTIACPVPERLRHPRGKVVQCLLGVLEPGEVRTASFIARAVDPGPARPELTVTADGGLRAAVTSPLTVRPAVVCR